MGFVWDTGDAFGLYMPKCIIFLSGHIVTLSTIHLCSLMQYPLLGSTLSYHSPPSLPCHILSHAADSQLAKLISPLLRYPQTNACVYSQQL